jgi:hypothetical protein
MQILSCIIYFISIFHIGNISISNLSSVDHKIQFDFFIDAKEFQMLSANETCTTSSMQALCVVNYINNRCVLKINSKLIQFELTSASNVNGHLKVRMTSLEKHSKIESIELENTCFYDVYPSYKNRIVLDFEEYQKSYLLTQKKNTINLY